MQQEERFTADKAARILQSYGYDITKRKVNYYAFDKKMFQVEGSGKKAFTRKDIDKIRAILFLRERSTMSLDQIKQEINIEDFSLAEIERRHRSFSSPKPDLQFQTMEMVNYSSSYLPSEEKYALEFYDSHIIILIGGKKVLLGTGASRSIGRDKLYLLDRKYPLEKTYLKADIDALGGLLGCKLNAMLGGDILKDLHLMIDCIAKKATFSALPLDHKRVLLPVELILNVPVLDIILGEQTLKVFLDTGTRVSYLREDIYKRYTHLPATATSDYYPGFKRFAVETRKIPFRLIDYYIDSYFALLPEPLETVLSMAGCDGIIGLDLFRYFGSIYFNLQNNLISLDTRDAPLA